MGRLWYSLDTWHQVVRLKAFYSVWPFSLSAVLPLRNLVSFHSRGSDRPSSPKQKKTKKTPSGRMTQSRYWASHVCVWTHQITEPLFYSSLCSKCLEGECDLVRESEINYRGRVPDGFPTKCRLTVFIKVKCWTSKFVFVWFSHQQTALWTLGSQPHMVSPGVQMSRYSNRSRIWLLCVCNTL